MKAYEIIEINRTIQSGIKIALHDAISGTNASKDDYDIDVDHNNYIVVSERELFNNTDEDGEEYEDERWSDNIIVFLNRNTNKFEIAKIWSRPTFDYWIDGGKKDWESQFLSNLNHYLKSVIQYF